MLTGFSINMRSISETLNRDLEYRHTCAQCERRLGHTRLKTYQVTWLEVSFANGEPVEQPTALVEPVCSYCEPPSIGQKK